MFKKKTAAETTTQELIDSLNSHMFGIEPDSPEYDKCLGQRERLHKILAQESDGKKVSPDTVAIIIANLAGIALILNYEHIHVVTSKALSFITKLKI